MNQFFSNIGLIILFSVLLFVPQNMFYEPNIDLNVSNVTNFLLNFYKNA